MNFIIIMKFIIILIIVCTVINLGIGLLKDIKWHLNRKQCENKYPDITAALDRWHQAELEFQKKDKEKNENGIKY